MSVSPGTRLGPYEVLGPLGAGGMGEVFRARDARLGREVAIKVLPIGVASDPERVARFEQEARAVAALNHPNILAVYDIGRHENAPFIVSELLEGDTLRQRLSAGALPVRKAIEYAIQLARGLAAAHDKGIVHRDLKPENVFVTADGRVKILDFGLAKLTEREAVPAGVSEAATKSNTQAGMVLGTIGYMAPEQVRGQTVDHRADVFAFGVVLYEMLAGRRAFQRETTIDTMTAILKEDPPDLPSGDRSLPPALERILDRCLEKAPTARFQSTGDLAFALEALSSQSGSMPALAGDIPLPQASGTRNRLAWALVAVLAVAAVALAALLYLRRAPVTSEATRFVVLPPDGWALATQLQSGAGAGPLAVAPDGRQVAFVGRDASGSTLIWIRSLDTLEANGLAGTEGGVSPFWSPDSRSLGFFADGKLKRIDVAGGPPVTLCNTMPGISGAWSPDGVIVFSEGLGTPLQKVSASGGVPAPATVLQEGERDHARPIFLPDGRHFVFRANFPTGSRGPAFVGSLDSAEERTRLMEVDSTNVVYSQRHLLFLRERTLMAQPFDPDRLVLAGEPFPIAEQIQTLGATAYGFFSASPNGVLTYQTGTAVALPQLAWLDRTGKVVETIGKPAPYGDLALGPDERSAIVRIVAGQVQQDLWLLDLARDGLATRFTFDPAQDYSPVWSSDGERVIFSSLRKAPPALYQKASSGAGNEELLLDSMEEQVANDWSSDGRYLLFTRVSVKTQADLWVLPTFGDGKAFPFLQTPALEGQGSFSPDGKWIAYVSNESGRPEVYVSPFDGSSASGGKRQVSASGGNQPHWSTDGPEIFYLSLPPTPQLMAASVTVQGTALDVGAVTPLFAVRPPGTGGSMYHPSRDGKRFLVNQSSAPDTTPTPITVVVNWTAGLKN
jgi:eukaryotic-like serine/threonine-protein kinase